MPDTGFLMLDTGSWLLDAGYQIPDAGYWILDTGSWIPEAGFLVRVQDVERLKSDERSKFLSSSIVIPKVFGFQRLNTIRNPIRQSDGGQESKIR